MKFLFLKPVVAGLIRCQIKEAGPVEKTADMLLYRMSVMPVYLSVPMVILTLLFDAGAMFRSGRRFRSQSAVEQTRYVQAIKKSRLGICKDFMQFYEKMGTFIYFAQQEKAATR